MVETYNIRVVPRVAADGEQVALAVARQAGVARERIESHRIVRRSIDARGRQVYVNLSVLCSIDEPMPEGLGKKNYDYGNVADKPACVVVGAGPGGLFAALRLIELGIKPIVLERGKDVDSRRLDLANISRKGIVDEDSNYSFGEGGAGAYSDGKLYTRSKKRGDVTRILQIFNRFGASDDILIDAHPHIGSDRLPKIIKAMREQIISSGGEVHFSTRVTRLLVEDDTVVGVECSAGEQYVGPVILATGHSARDVYRMLHDSGIALEAKGIAVGVRLEHPQHLIDQIQYHSREGRGKYLPAA